MVREYKRRRNWSTGLTKDDCLVKKIIPIIIENSNQNKGDILSETRGFVSIAAITFRNQGNQKALCAKIDRISKTE